MTNKGRLIILSGPSGVGKGTVVKRILAEVDNIMLSVSATTRSPREEDTDGVTYYFKTKDEFIQMIEDEKFLEWAEYNGNYYGTPLDAVNEKLNDGIDVILEIEIQGALNVMKRCPNALSIFIAPPSVDELRKRLIGRGSESDEEIKNRIAVAVDELKAQDRYRFVVVNDVLDDAVNKVKEIIERKDVK